MNNELRKTIRQYQDLKWEPLLKKEFTQHSLEEVNDNLDRIKKIFDFLVNHKKLDSLSNDYQNQLKNQLAQFFNFSNSIRDDYTNIKDKAKWVEQVKSKEKEIWSHLGPLIEYLNFIYPTKDETNEFHQTLEGVRDIKKVAESTLSDLQTAKQKQSESYQKSLREIERIKKTAQSELSLVTQAKEQIQGETDELHADIDTLKQNIEGHQELFQRLVDRVLEHKKNYEEAERVIGNLLSNYNKAINKAIEGKIQDYNKKADEHKGKVPALWLMAGGVFGLFALYVTFWFLGLVSSLIPENSKGASEIYGAATATTSKATNVIINGGISDALLHTSALLILGSFSVYCLRKFTLHNRLYELYKFKSITLKTAKDLRDEVEDGEREQILSKALNALFSEPTFKDKKEPSEKVNSELLSSLISKLVDRS